MPAAGENGASALTPPAPARRGRGRPRIEIDWNVFDALCQVQCTKEEIATFFRVNQSTIERAVRRDKRTTFDAYRESHAGFGKLSLRRKQFQLALNGNVAMLIWLGKQALGQSDQAKVKQEVSGPEGRPVEVNVDDVRQRINSRIDSIAARLASSGSIAGSN